MKTKVNLFSRFLSVSRELEVKNWCKNVLSCELSAVPLNLCYLNGAMRHTVKSNLLNEIEIKRYSLTSLMVNLDLGATVTEFMAILLQSINYCKFKIFHNADDEISIKLFPNFLQFEVLVVVPDQYDFEFSIKADKRKCQTKDSAHIEVIYILSSNLLK